MPGPVTQPPRAPVMPKSGAQPSAPQNHLPGPCQGRGPNPALEQLMSLRPLEWRGHTLSHRSGRPAHPSGTAQPGLAAGQGFTEQFLFPAHSPTHRPPSLEKQIPTSCLFPNKLRASTHRLSSPTRPAGRGHPTTAGSESRWDGQDPAGDPHVQGQQLSHSKQEGPRCAQPLWCLPASAPHGQARSLVLGRCRAPLGPGLSSPTPLSSCASTAWQRSPGKLGQGRMAHSLPGVHGDPRKVQVTPTHSYGCYTQPFIIVTLLGTADPGRGVPLWCHCRCPLPGHPPDTIPGPRRCAHPRASWHVCTFWRIPGDVPVHQPSPCPDQEAEGVSKSWQEPGWPGGSGTAGVGMPCSFGELRFLLRSIAGGCSPLAALPDKLCCQTLPALHFS